ncbi:MAG: 4Fe-4S binding protein [Syntrophobacteraceae bacterium]
MSDTQSSTITSLSEKKKILPLTALRRLSQAVLLGTLGQWSFYGIFRCPFLVPYVSCQNCPVITCHGRILTMFWGFWLLLPLSVLLVGRAFCGWACPGGIVSQLAGKAAPFKLRTRRLPVRYARAGQYIALFCSLAAYFYLGQPRANVPIRTGGFFESVGLTFEHAGMLWLVRSFIVIGFVVLGFLAANAWCRFACPTGGIIEAIKRFSLFSFHKTPECNGCNECLRVCEMGTRPGEANCTNCGDCLDVCPTEAIRFGRKKS